MRSSEALKDLVVAVSEELKEARDDLNRLDGIAGDGDLGLTVSTGALALMALAPSLVELPESEAIRRMGTEIARRAPSTAGTLVALALLAAAKAGVDPTAPPGQRAAGYLAAAAESIATRGNVARGDRTMLDALQPAAEAFMTAATDADSWSTLRDAAIAADLGARSTATMAAKVGRAGWLADRAAGHEDAGAYLVSLAFAAAARYRATVEGRHSNGREDYFQWQSLFVVMAELRAAAIAEALEPGIRIDDQLRQIASDFLRGEAVVITNADADAELGRAIARLETATDGQTFARLTDLGRLLELDTSEKEPAAAIWAVVLRRWAREPEAGGSEHREFAASILDMPGLEKLESPGISDLHDWQILLSSAQDKLIYRSLEARLEILPEAAGETLREDARNTAAGYGIPRDVIPS